MKNRHLLLLLFVPLYLTAFYLIEKFITTDYWVSYIPLDDSIPFLEVFVIPYCIWYPFMIVTGLYLLLKDVPAFKRYMWFIIIGFTTSLTICALLPNGQDLRPLVFERVNFCSKMVEAIYQADTNTNVLPSMHVVGTLATAFAIFDSPGLKNRVIRIITIIFTILICMSTVFIKQHSILDIFAGIAVCIPIYFVVYRRSFFNKN